MSTDLMQVDGPAAQVEIVPPAEVTAALGSERDQLLRQIGTGKLTGREAKVLRAAVDAPLDIINVKPTGEVYVPGVFYRKVLNEAFGPLQWGVRPGNVHLDVKEDKRQSILYREVFLIVRGKCAAVAIGAQPYHPKNARMTYDDAAEAATTNGLMRCCKTLGIYQNCWEPTWAEQARAERCVKVRIREHAAGEGTKTQWRLLEREPFDGEIGLANGSPNAEGYRLRMAERRAEQDNAQNAATAGQNQPREGAATQPAASARPAESVAPAAGERVLVCRPVKFIDQGTGEQREFYVIQGEAREYVTQDAAVLRTAENAKTRGLRIKVDYEQVQAARGKRNVIKALHVLEPEKPK